MFNSSRAIHNIAWFVRNKGGKTRFTSIKGIAVYTVTRTVNEQILLVDLKPKLKNTRMSNKEKFKRGTKTHRNMALYDCGLILSKALSNELR